MRRINVTEGQPIALASKEFTDTHSTMRGSPKSKPQAESTISAVSKHLPKLLPQEPKPRAASTENLRASLKLVRSGGVDEGADASGPEPSTLPGSLARPGLVQQVEPFAAIARDLPPLFERHWQELGTRKDEIPLDPDWDRYFALAQVGTLRVRTARVDGVLAGYIFNMVGPHLHYRSTLHAEIEMFWLDTAYRGMGVVGMNHWFVMDFFRDNDADLKALGVKRISVAVKNGYKDGRVGLVFKRLGYSARETVFVRDC